mgnify:CR=1 FL=1
MNEAIYEIRVQGYLGDEWSEWLGDVSSAMEEGGSTLLRTAPLDQAALHGLLLRLHDLGTALMSVQCVARCSHDDDE